MTTPVLSTPDAIALAAVAVVVLQYTINSLLPKKEAEGAFRFTKAFSGILLLPGVVTFAVSYATAHPQFLTKYPWVSLAAAVIYYVAEKLRDTTSQPVATPTTGEY